MIKIPKWQRDLKMFLPIYSNFILGGAVHDIQFFTDNGRLRFDTVEKLIKETYGRDYRVVVYDLVRGEGQRFSFRERLAQAVQGEGAAAESADRPPQPQGDPAEESELTRIFSGKFQADDGTNKSVEYKYDHNDSGPTLDLAKLGEMLVGASMAADDGGIVTRSASRRPKMVLIKAASRLSVRPGEVGCAEELKLYTMLFDIMQRNKNNKIIVLVEKFNDLPNWLEDETNNPFVKKLLLLPPDTDYRREFFAQEVLGSCPELKAQYDRLKEGKDGEKKQEDAVQKFSVYTDGYTSERLLKLRKYLQDKGAEADLSKLGTEITLFDSGSPDNPWSPETRNRLAMLESECGKVIKGQKNVLEQAQKIMSLAATGLNRLDNTTAPRAVLFLAGPTGTGKTELAKQIAKIVFGREDKMVRFDMSEFAQEHSDARLFGAPPGYVGYDAGGELTNAAKEKPFSVFLFDEIEKAAPRILDKFLQILSDGRLTSGKGETVWFSDSIIIMTSNAGIEPVRSQEDFLASMNPANKKDEQKRITIEEYGEGGPLEGQLDAQLRKNLKEFFSTKIKRPELYGRLENAIITYDYIKKQAAKEIAAARLKKIVESAAANANIYIEDYEDVAEKICEYAQRADIRAMGGRGVIGQTDMHFVGGLANSVSQMLVDRPEAANAPIRMRPTAVLEGDKLTVTWEEV